MVTTKSVRADVTAARKGQSVLRNGCILTRIGEHFEMYSAVTRTSHSLFVSATDAARLKAHWEVFCGAK